MTPLRPLALPLVALLLALAASSVPILASAATPPTARAPVESEIATDPSGEPRLSLTPLRFEPTSVTPGDRLALEIVVANELGTDVRIVARAIPLTGSTDPARIAQPTTAAADPSAAIAEWVSFPGFGTQRRLANGAKLRIPVHIDVPRDARPGSHAVGLAVAQYVGALGGATPDAPASRVRVGLNLSTVAIIRVPGTAESSARIRSVSQPRVVWGGAAPEFVARVQNVGNTDLLIDGELDLQAFLGSAGRTLDAAGPAKGQRTLPGGVRDVRMRWSDPPLLGWFHPELVVVGGSGSGVRLTDQLDAVFVLPPWWLLVLLAVALVLPLRARRRRRRSPAWQELQRDRAKERVEERLRHAEAKRRAAAARGRRPR